MPRISDQVIEEIKQRIDIVDLIGARVSLKHAGSSYKACCPFHNEKTPSFHVNPARQTFHCFGCGVHGNVIDFVMRSDGLPFPEAVRMLAEKAGVAVDTETDYAGQARAKLLEIHSELGAFYERCLLQTAEGRIAREYLASRDLGEDVRAAFGIGYAMAGRDIMLRWGQKHGYDAETLVSAGLLAPPKEPGSNDYYDRFHGRLMFPIRDSQGRTIAFSGRLLRENKHTGKYVNSPETPIFTKGRTLYALDKARANIVKDPRREAIVCEGQIDVIRCHSAGFATAVAAQGTAFTRDHAEILKRYADSVLLVFDADGAGVKAAVRTGGIFLELDVPVRVAVLPAGEDPDSLIRKQGAAAFRDALDAAVSLTTFQIRSLRAKEQDPNAVDAVARIARAALEPIAGCTKAVLRSSLLQDAANELHIPLSALEEDLVAVREERAKRASFESRRASQPAIAPIQAVNVMTDEAAGFEPATPAPRDDDGGCGDDDAPPPTDDFAPPDGDEFVAEADFAGDFAMEGARPAPRPRPQRAEPVPKALYGICELLMHHEGDDAPYRVLADFLPMDLVTHPDARAFIAAAVDSRLSGHDRIAELSETATGGLRELIAALIRNESRVMRASEATPLQAMQDCICRVWADALAAERAELDAHPADDSRTRRFQLTVNVKTLRQSDSKWGKREKVIRAEMERRGLIPPPPSQPSADDAVPVVPQSGLGLSQSESSFSEPAPADSAPSFDAPAPQDDQFIDAQFQAEPIDDSPSEFDLPDEF